jgi:putative DNA primase/helicase
MSFTDFAYQYGLIIDSLIMGRWARVKTLDKPNKTNGAYIFDGCTGAVINFATMEIHVPYKSDKPFLVDYGRIKQANEDKLAKRAVASQKAEYILKNAKKAKHPYLSRKGFDENGWVWKEMLIVPMRVDGKLVGCQMISADGTKKFLSGQLTKGASLVMDEKGRDVLVEGFATGLSVRRALRLLGVTFKIHVCFSASNMLEIAKNAVNPLVVADNDAVGVRTAKKIASAYWVGEASEDFNDCELRLGTPIASLGLKRYW